MSLTALMAKKWLSENEVRFRHAMMDSDEIALSAFFAGYEAAQQEAASDGAKCAACGSLKLVPAVHCQDCGYSLPPRA